MKDEFGLNAAPVEDIAPAPSAQNVRPTITLDVTHYESFLADSDLTADQKREFIEALWSIVLGFVDLGFGIDPVRQARRGDVRLEDGPDTGLGIALIASADTEEITIATGTESEIIETAPKGRKK